MNSIDQIIQENAWRQIGATAIVLGKYCPEQRGHILLERERYYRGKLVAKREITIQRGSRSHKLTVYDMETVVTVNVIGSGHTQTFLIENIPWNKLEPGGD